MAIKNPRISAVVAISKDGRAIGNNNKLLWHIPDDLKRFKEITMGHPVIMGRKTFESILSILGQPLPGRENIVITRQENYNGAGAKVVASLDEGISLAKLLDKEEIFIGGGQEIYQVALPLIDRLYLTIIESKKEADTFFPPYEHLFKKEIYREEREHQGLHYTWVNIEKNESKQ